MKKIDCIEDIKVALNNLQSVKEKTLNSHFTRYIIDYKIEDKYIKIMASNGDYRKVKNTKSNIRKIDQVIVKNKIEIARRIDSYEGEYRERLFVLLFNLMMVAGTGALVPFSFFTGIYAFFLFSIIVFAISTVTVSISGFKLYFSLKEIQKLKKLTGYKKDNEFAFNKLGLHPIKERN